MLPQETCGFQFVLNENRFQLTSNHISRLEFTLPFID